jgi:catechol 2,3-dioxygenase-like lactoylglutathione lyase family enzyme
MAAFRGRFDHAVILVADLIQAGAAFERLGFTVSPGGEHTGLGTHNALIRFGVDYLELLAVRDEAEAAGAGRSRSEIVERIHAGNGGLASFALATSDIEADAARLRDTGLAATGPFAMQRRRPDGKLLSWRLLVPAGSQWGRPWPFFIQWDQDDRTRLEWERQAAHRNGARRVAGVSVAVRDLDAATDLYTRQLGLARGADAEAPELASRQRAFRVDGFAIAVHTPVGPGWLADRLAAAGEGIFEVALEVEALDAALDALAQANITPERSGSALIVPSAAALGARLTFTQKAD